MFRVPSYRLLVVSALPQGHRQPGEPSVYDCRIVFLRVLIPAFQCGFQELVTYRNVVIPGVFPTFRTRQQPFAVIGELEDWYRTAFRTVRHVPNQTAPFHPLGTLRDSLSPTLASSWNDGRGPQLEHVNHVSVSDRHHGLSLFEPSMMAARTDTSLS